MTLRDTEQMTVVTFTGDNEAELLREAAQWLADHEDTMLVALNWINDMACPSSRHHPTGWGADLTHRLDLTVKEY